MSNDANADSEEIPNHAIVWLDLNIGRREDYQRLKAAFSSTADPNHANPVRLFDRDDEEINRTVGFEQVNFEGVKFLLAAFTNVERCVKFLQDEKRKIFLITSGQMGRAILPLIKQKCIDVFTDPITNEPCQSIYVFCHSTERNMDWMLQYYEYLAPPFTFDADLLVRMIRDIANYFVIESKHLLESDPPNYSAAYNRLTWAHTLYDRYRTMENNSLTREFTEVNNLLGNVEQQMRRLNNDD
ncbi:unnamed protein product [Adineta steineri]|uniref:Uncharacterized protein n=1 Tax=Adineta steineri TaxID=433720 RepID=A0A814WJ70_9BILA|nr:unnamed protein product [Adineta steineri]CAF1202284.1 unnamed protein product [Adineta steineri]CAF1215117.1 unnamed protein product [Adineta steineri]CAF3758993.1 unnamed protein product [Adineta steineri]CAF3759667.1 unnamed protein product [Adineta steineri]